MSIALYLRCSIEQISLDSDYNKYAEVGQTIVFYSFEFRITRSGPSASPTTKRTSFKQTTIIFHILVMASGSRQHKFRFQVYLCGTLNS